MLLSGGFRALRKRLYPLRYERFILETSREFGMSPFLIAAVIRVESNFRPDVTSSKGARGLMQVLPDTGQHAAASLGLREYTPDMLFDPQMNIRLGTWYLSLLMAEFEGDLSLALAAYNGGLSNVREWRKQGLVKAGGGGTAGIPFRETREFIVRVNEALENYKELYTEELAQMRAKD